MPRIRTVKPEVWTDRKFVRLSPYARLFFIGMWNFALCDDGHIEDDDFQLRLKILPADNVDAAELIDELVASGMVHRLGEIDGEPYLHIVGLRRHQKTDARWTPRCPVCTHSSSPDPAETHASLGEPHRDSDEFGGDSPQEGKGKEGKGKEGNTTSAKADEKPARPEVEHLCTYLAEKVEANGAKRPGITARWRDEARKLIDLDGYTPQQIAWVIDWATADEFWSTNVLSMPTLRKQFEKLKLKALAERKHPVSKTQREIDEWLAKPPSAPSFGTTPYMEVTQ